MEMNFSDQVQNLLPYDGIVNYCGKVLSREQAGHYFERLMTTIEWRNDEAIIFGKHFITKRKVAWYGDRNFHYTYASTTKEALRWTNDLMELKSIAEELTQTAFNSCLLNLYHTGDEGMGWHSDDEKSLETNAPIASMSLGAERSFSFRHKKTKQTIHLVLENGSLLIMKHTTQSNWLHSLPKSKKIISPRINLTFRNMRE